MSSASLSTAPVGLLSGRFLKSWVIGKADMNSAISYAMGRRGSWGADTPHLYAELMRWPDVYKGTADPMNSTNSAALMTPAGIVGDFMGLTAQTSALARLTGIRKFPANRAVVGFTSGSSAALTDEFQRVAVSKAALATVALTPHKICGLVVVTQEVALGSTSDGALSSDLARAVSFASDIFALDPNAPFSIANGCTSFASTGSTLTTVDADIVRAYNLSIAATPDGSPLNKSWITSPRNYSFLATLRGTGGNLAYPTVGMSSPTLLGLPLLVTGALSANTSPQAGTMLLVSGDQIAMNSNSDVGIISSSEGTVLMDSAPASNEQQETSLWMTDSVGLLAVRWLSVARQSVNSVIAITAAAWA